MTAAVTGDVAGAQMGGAARYRDELLGYLFRLLHAAAATLTELLAAVGDLEDPLVGVQVKAHAAEVPAAVTCQALRHRRRGRAICGPRSSHSRSEIRVEAAARGPISLQRTSSEEKNA